MSDEVKQAADRLRRCRESDCGYVGMFADVDTLIAGYLSEHANDAENATPLSFGVLQESGWIDDYDEFGSPVKRLDGYGLALRKMRDGWSAMSQHADGYAVFGGNHKTVGDLRKLLDALHIPAVVVVPKGEERC